MKLRPEFITHNSSDESYLVPTSGARDQVVAAMKERFEAPEGAIERDVDRVISELQKIGALE